MREREKSDNIISQDGFRPKGKSPDSGPGIELFYYYYFFLSITLFKYYKTNCTVKQFFFSKSSLLACKPLTEHYVFERNSTIINEEIGINTANSNE